MYWQILETKVSVKVSHSHFLTTLLLNSLFTRSRSIFLAASNANHSAKLFLWMLRYGATNCTLWRGHIDVTNSSCNFIAIKHRLQLVFMHWRSRWACCKLIVLKRWCPDRRVKRTSWNLWNFGYVRVRRNKFTFTSFLSQNKRSSYRFLHCNCSLHIYFIPFITWNGLTILWNDLKL